MHAIALQAQSLIIELKHVQIITIRPILAVGDLGEHPDLVSLADGVANVDPEVGGCGHHARPELQELVPPSGILVVVLELARWMHQPGGCMDIACVPDQIEEVQGVGFHVGDWGHS